MFSGYRTIFWGLFVITFHINFITIPILPAFVGYMIMSSGVGKLQEEFASENFNKARMMAQFMAILGVLSFFLLWVPEQYFLLSFLPVVYSVMELYFTYHLVEGSADHFRAEEKTEREMNYKSELGTYMVFSILFIIALCISITVADQTMIIIVAIVGVLLRIWLMAMMGRLKREQEEPIAEASFEAVSEATSETPSDTGSNIDERV